MPKPKPSKPTSIRLSEKQKKFLEKIAEAQGHYSKSEAMKRLVNREMGETTH